MAFQELLSSNNKKAIERFQGWKKEHHIRMTDIYKGIAKIINNEKSDSQIFNSLRNWAAGRLPLPNHYVLPMMEFFKEKSVDLDKDLTKEFGLHSDTSTVQSAKIRRFLQQSDSHTILGTERKLAEILGKNENSIRKLWKGKTRDLRYPLSKYEANEIKKTFPDDSWDAKLSEDMENPPKRARKKE
jgi:hypothetical protein